MRKWLRPASLVTLLVGLLGCSSAPTEPAPQVHELEQSAVDALSLSMEAEARSSLDAALKRYQTLDDLDGQWRVHQMKANLALRDGDTAGARRHADSMLAIAPRLDTAHTWFQTYVLQHRTSGNPVWVTRAEPYASTDLERALLKTYQGKHAEALSLLDHDAGDNPADRAYVFYQAGAYLASMDLLNRALAYYRLAEDARGVADSLFRMAVITIDTDTTTAREYARRAIIVLEASGNNALAAQVNEWLNGQ